MATQVYMKHDAGVTKPAYHGFSWTVFLFGIWPPLFRGDLKWFGLSLVISIVNMLLMQAVPPLGVVTTLVWWIFFAAKYNEWHMDGLLLTGFKVVK
jgi:hypothetical protein